MGHLGFIEINSLLSGTLFILLGMFMIFSAWNAGWRRWPPLSRALWGTLFVCVGLVRVDRGLQRTVDLHDWIANFNGVASFVEALVTISLIVIFIRFLRGTMIQ